MNLVDGRLKLRHLALVDALTEQGSLVGAAARLRVSQPSLTRALHEVEEILGVPLYERGPRGMTPTPYGTAFTTHARAVLAQLTRAQRHIEDLADGRGTVTVGVHLAGAGSLVPAAIERLKAERPGTTVVLREANPEVLMTDLLAGRVDLTVGRLTGAGGTEVRRTRLYDDPVQLVARVGHPAFDAPVPTLADLLGYPWVLPGPDTPLLGEVAQVFAAQDLPLPADRVECTAIPTLRRLLLSGNRIAALPATITGDDPELAVLPTLFGPLVYAIGVTVPRQPLTPAAQLFVDHLTAAASA